jgi:hypothetical protein
MDNKIKEYLLGQLTSHEREQVEERLLVDSEFLEEALIVEDEIIDAYLNDTLSEQENFIKSFFSTPQRRQKLVIAMAFQRYASESGDEATLSKIQKEAGLRSWFRLFGWPFRHQHSHSAGITA